MPSPYDFDTGIHQPPARRHGQSVKATSRPNLICVIRIGLIFRFRLGIWFPLNTEKENLLGALSPIFSKMQGDSPIR